MDQQVITDLLNYPLTPEERDYATKRIAHFQTELESFVADLGALQLQVLARQDLNLRFSLEQIQSIKCQLESALSEMTPLEKKRWKHKKPPMTVKFGTSEVALSWEQQQIFLNSQKHHLLKGE